MARSISFVIDGDVNTLVTITEQIDGALRFDLSVQDTGLTGDLRAIFFDLQGVVATDALSVAAVAEHEGDVTDSKFDEESVDTLGKDANIKGSVSNELGDFDVGVEFGTSGMSKDDIQETSFILASDDGPLSLNALDLTDFGIRYTSVGEDGGKRTDSAKIGDQSNGVANDDVLMLDENTVASVDLLEFDTNGGSNILTAAFDADGAFNTIAGGFTREVVVEGRNLGLLTVTAAGIATFDANGPDVNALAVDEQHDFVFSYTTTAPDGSLATADVNLTVFGVNDVPDITVEAGDSAFEAIDEANGGLTVIRALTLTDLDLSDFVDVSVMSVLSSGNDGDPATPNNGALLGMMMLSPTDVLDDTETIETFDWTFDSGGEAFNYLAGDEFLRLDYRIRATDDNGATDDQIVIVTVNGANDTPNIAVEAGDSASEAIDETNAGLAVDRSLTLTDLDTTDIVDVSVVSVLSSGKNDDSLTPNNTALLGMLSLAPTTVLDGTEKTDQFQWFIDSGGETFDYLALGELLQLDYTVRATDDNGATDDQIVTMTVNGTNDQPVAEDVAGNIGEDDPSVNGNFVGSDLDTTDVLSFQILGAPTDAFGNQYGSVTNNNDGTFTFDPLDNFQFLEAGETRDVTFQYVAIDDSGAANDTSEAKTVTVTVNGAFDAPIDLNRDLLFETENRSMFGSGEALVLQPDLPFFGIDESVSLDATILPSQEFSGNVLSGILDGIEAVANAFADAGCTVAGWFGADCDADIDVPDSISTPSVRTDGELDLKMGLQPYFFLTTGDVDASIPVDVVFTTPKQVEAGESFAIGSAYSIDDGATFNTMSPNVNFGMDFVFDVDTELDLRVGGDRIDLFDFNTANIDDFEGELGEPGFNIFNFSAEDDLETSINLGGIATLDLNFPVINTEGELVDANTLESRGEDDVAVLDIDVDALVSLIPGVPPFSDSNDFGLTIDIAGESLNLISVEYAWDVVRVNLIATLSAIQNFTLDVLDLPLLATLEDGSQISGFSLGDEIAVTAPNGFDADVNGDGDGFIDFSVDVDMDAVFENLSTLGLSLELFTGLLKFTGGITSDFFDGPEFSLFGDKSNGSNTNNDFFTSKTFTFLDDEPLATLFEEEFALLGFEENPNTQDTFAGAFDVA